MTAALCTTPTFTTTTTITTAAAATTGTSTVGATVDAERRVEFWRHAGDLYGLPLSHAQLAEACWLDDLAVVDRFFPTLSDAERSEVLWSLGAYLSG